MIDPCTSFDERNVDRAIDSVKRSLVKLVFADRIGIRRFLDTVHGQWS